MKRPIGASAVFFFISFYGDFQIGETPVVGIRAEVGEQVFQHVVRSEIVRIDFTRKVLAANFVELDDDVLNYVGRVVDWSAAPSTSAKTQICVTFGFNPICNTCLPLLLTRSLPRYHSRVPRDHVSWDHRSRRRQVR